MSNPSALYRLIVIKFLKSEIRRYAVTTELPITAGCFITPNYRANFYFISEIQDPTCASCTAASLFAAKFALPPPASSRRGLNCRLSPRVFVASLNKHRRPAVIGSGITRRFWCLCPIAWQLVADDYFQTNVVLVCFSTGFSFEAQFIKLSVFIF